MRLHILILLALTQLPPAASSSRLHPADQVRLIDGEVAADLLARDIDVVLAEGDARPQDVNATIRRLILDLRAGRRDQAASDVDRLGALGIDLDVTRAVLGFLVNRHEMDLTARLVERVPGSGREFSSNIVGYWLTLAPKSPEQIDQWLADRGWTSDRLRLAARSKNDGPLVTQIIAEARSQGCTETTLDRVLATASQASAPVTLDWIPAWCQTPSATAARDLGERAAAMRAPAVAVVFFERALAMPFTHEDAWLEMRGRSVVPIRSDAEWERRFRAQTRVALAQAYRDTGDPTRAATILDQLSSEDRSMVTPTELADAAGLLQSRSVARPAERAVPPTAPPKPERTEVGGDRVVGERVRLRQQFQADIRSGDWRSAEAVWTALLRVESPAIEASHDLSSAAYLLAQLADAAVQHGDTADALRFWRRLANVDRTVGLNRLEGFPLTRLRAELTIFYEAMAQRDPASWVPAAALEKLRRR